MRHQNIHRVNQPVSATMQLDFNIGSLAKEEGFKICQLFTDDRPPLIEETFEASEASEADIPFEDDESVLGDWLNNMNSFPKTSKKMSKEEEIENKVGVLREQSFDSKTSDLKSTLWEMTPPREDDSGAPFKLHPFKQEDASPASDNKFWKDDESNQEMGGLANGPDKAHGDVLSLRPQQTILSDDALAKLQSHFMKRSVGSKRKMDSICKSSKKMKQDIPSGSDDEKRMAYYIANRLVKGTLML